MLKRKTRAQQAEHNREQVLAAARRVFEEKGYYAATLDEMAEEAGFSKGVVYSQFGSKADLFFALLNQRIEQRAAQNLDTIMQRGFQDSLGALIRLAEETRRRDRAWTLLVLEFRIHAARDPELRERYAAAHRRSLEGLTRVFEHLIAGSGRPYPFRASDIARLVAALDNGYALEESIDPEGWSTAPGGAALMSLFRRQSPTDGEDDTERSLP